MKVNELQDKGSIDEITLKITEKQQPRSMRGETLHVCNLTGEDETGSVVIALWNDDIDKVNVGNKITIKEGWARVFNNEMQVSRGKNGILEVVTE